MKYLLKTAIDRVVLDIDEELELRAMVASGDCFELLASRLDQIKHISNDQTARLEI